MIYYVDFMHASDGRLHVISVAYNPVLLLNWRERVTNHHALQGVPELGESRW